jgi:hypothetical protein
MKQGILLFVKPCWTSQKYLYAKERRRVEWEQAGMWRWNGDNTDLREPGVLILAVREAKNGSALKVGLVVTAGTGEGL